MPGLVQAKARHDRLAFRRDQLVPLPPGHLHGLAASGRLHLRSP